MTKYFLSILNKSSSYFDDLIKNQEECFDYIIITAANTKQAKYYEKQISNRKTNLPAKTNFLIIADDNSMRIGSGGALLSALKEYKNLETSFVDKKILLINSGGDAKRIFPYSATGKLFMPVMNLDGSNKATLFDLLMIMTCKTPKNMKEGMLVLSGDVLLLFDQDQVCFEGKGIKALSFKSEPEKGEKHGVYIGDENNKVIKFLHKKKLNELIEYNAIDENNEINIDTGAVFLGTDFLESLFSLISENNVVDELKYKKLVNEKIQLSLYGDFIYALASDTNLDDFIDNELNEELIELKKHIYNSLRKYSISLLKASPAIFIHLGTSREYYEYLIDNNKKGTKSIYHCNSSIKYGYNSMSYSINKDSYFENSYIHSNVSIGERSMIYNLEVYDVASVPENVIVYGTKLVNGKYVCCICDIDDNPKDKKIFGKSIPEELWNYNLYPQCDDMDTAFQYGLAIWEIFNSSNKTRLNQLPDKISMSEIMTNIDYDYLDSWESHLYDLIEISKIEDYVDDGIEVNKIKVQDDDLNDNQLTFLDMRFKNSNLIKRIKMYRYIAYYTNNEKYIDRMYNLLSSEFIKYNLPIFKYVKTKEKVLVSLPLRVNFAGGWTDTIPYCLEYGGEVLNASILIDDRFPVTVKLEKIKDECIIIESIDNHAYKRFYSIEEIKDIKHLSDPFLLFKATLIVSGILADFNNIQDLTKHIGGGISLKCYVSNVPKGSGLGTSSIIGAACMKALYDFMNIEYTNQDIYDSVLCVEQMIGTGGGWQDQAGAYSKGIKYISSCKGIRQEITIEKLDLSREFLKKMNQRFVLIYTGQTRLARDILRKIENKYLGHDGIALNILNEIKIIARKMKKEIIKNNINEFGKLLVQHYEAIKKLDEGSSNELIENIFTNIDDLIIGKMVCGAGGGGFLQVILKENITKDELKNRIELLYPNTDIKVYDVTLIQ